MVMLFSARDPKRIEVVGLGRLFALAYPLLQEIRPIAGHDEHELGHDANRCSTSKITNTNDAVHRMNAAQDTYG